MEIVKSYPPNIQRIRRAFPIRDNTVFSYGGKIYNPNDVKIDKGLEIHEAVHAKQQGRDPDGWWERYIQDPEFRLSQEIEAYGAQYAYHKQTMKSKFQKWVLERIASDLSSEMYGNIISFGEASSNIRNYDK